LPRERRMIARSSFTSRKLKKCTDSEFLLFVHLVVEADDEGRGEGEPDAIEMKVGNRKWSAKKIESMMAHLSDAELVWWYTNNGGQYYEVVDFLEYQQGSWHGRSAKPSEIPSPSDSSSVLHHEWCTGPPTTVDGSTKRASNRSEEKGSKEKRKEEMSFGDDFEEWWNDYPNKQGKARSETYYAHWRQEGKSKEQLILARDCYVASKNGDHPVFANGSTFLNPKPKGDSANISDYFGSNPAQFSKEKNCSSCGQWDTGYCKLRQEKTLPDNHCKEWTPSVREVTA
jgi:hypothetical protein